MNSYNLSYKGHEETVIYHAIARNENEVQELANEQSIDLSDMVIVLERTNIRKQFGEYTPAITDAQVY